jgi:hypothetical protein
VNTLLDKVDWSTATPSQICWAVLGRWPDRDPVTPKHRYDAREHFLTLLRSNEFRDRVIELALSAFPEKTRLLFVHIPKCAGTDLEVILKVGSAALHTTVSLRAWADDARLLTTIRDFAVDLAYADSILVSGHKELTWFLKNNFHRAGDRLFTIVRNPTEMVLSQVNYMAGRLLEDREKVRTDTRGWLENLGMTDVGDLEPRALALRILHHPTALSANSICHYLGHNDAESAIRTLGSCAIEISESSRYNDWLVEAWGIRSATRHNKSRPLLSPNDLDARSQIRMRTLTAEDWKLYELLMSRMERRTALRGSELG